MSFCGNMEAQRIPRNLECPKRTPLDSELNWCKKGPSRIYWCPKRTFQKLLVSKRDPLESIGVPKGPTKIYWCAKRTLQNPIGVPKGPSRIFWCPKGTLQNFLVSQRDHLKLMTKQDPGTCTLCSNYDKDLLYSLPL